MADAAHTAQELEGAHDEPHALAWAWRSRPPHAPCWRIGGLGWVGGFEENRERVVVVQLKRWERRGREREAREVAIDHGRDEQICGRRKTNIKHRKREENNNLILSSISYISMTNQSVKQYRLKAITTQPPTIRRKGLRISWRRDDLGRRHVTATLQLC